jgi:membrane-associated phospholipid phosphatase
MRPRSVVPARYAVVTALAVLAVLGSVLAPMVHAARGDGTSAKDRIAAEPMPTLFPDPLVRATGERVDAQSPRAAALMSSWWSSHGSTRQDAAFVAWLERSLPGPPAAARRTAELRTLQALASHRSTQGVSAATWLETYGSKDVWKLYAHDQGEMLPPGAGDRRAADLKALLTMVNTVSDTLKAKFGQPSPYVLRPQLRPDKTVAPGRRCPCSYPSHHAASSAAARTFLSYLAPHRAPEYRWMESEVDYSRLYMAGHVSSDLTGGALLGDMIGQYFLVTRGHATVRAVAASAGEVALRREAVPAAGNARG